MALGTAIRKFRKDAGATQQETADRVGTSIDTYRRWEWGKLQPRADQLIRLVAVLGTTAEKLLYFEGEGEDKE